MRNRGIEAILNSLLTEKNSRGTPIITGYNYFPHYFIRPRVGITIFSNIHYCFEYLQDMLRDLCTQEIFSKIYSFSIRRKNGFFHWDPHFYIRNEIGQLQPTLHITDIVKRQRLCLEEYKTRTLEKSGFTKEDCKYLIAQEQGYEIDIDVQENSILKYLATLFIQRASAVQIGNTSLNSPIPWLNAWNVPAIFLRNCATNIRNFPGYNKAHLFQVTKPNIGEYSFNIHTHHPSLLEGVEYHNLLGKGFKVEMCLANESFIRYIDDI